MIETIKALEMTPLTSPSRVFVHSFIHSFIHLFIHSFVHLFIYLFIYLFSDYQVKRCLEFTRKLSWFSTLLFWNKTRGQDKTIIFLQNKGFPRRRRRPRRNCGVFWKGKFHVINYTRRTLLINWIELEVEIWQHECSTPLWQIRTRDDFQPVFFFF